LRQKEAFLRFSQDAVLDDAERFLEVLPTLPQDEQDIVLCVHLLCQMFDGDLDREEFEYWQRIFAVVREPGPAQRQDKAALQQVAREFR